jgi:bacterioferritin-associated ferredoxin
MIVCSCNVFSDHDVRNAVSGERPPRTPGQVYGCLGCSAQCGRCVRTIKKIMDEALGACAKSCCAGCPHTMAHAQGDAEAHQLHAEAHSHVDLVALAVTSAAA